VALDTIGAQVADLAWPATMLNEQVGISRGLAINEEDSACL
jgi:hypothetical protein